MVTMDEVTAKALRLPFKPEEVGKLPRIYCNACRNASNKVCDKHRQVRCDGCKNKISEAHLHLDYVGHAEITDRLLQVDPQWSWEPLAWDEHGLPRFDADNGLWIRLTVAGVTRLGYGDSDGKRGPSARKETIGDALRNAAMRFGVGLDLWGATYDPGQDNAEHQADEKPAVDPDVIRALTEMIGQAENRDQAAETWTAINNAAKNAAITAEAAEHLKTLWRQRRDHLKTAGRPDDHDVKRMFALLGKAEITDRDERIAWYANITGRGVSSTNDLTAAEVEQICAKTQAWIEQSDPGAAR